MAIASQTLMDQDTPLTPADARAAVREAVEDGVDFIKVHNTLSRDTYFAIVDESKKLGIPFVGHMPNGTELSLDVCALAGQRSFEHMQGVFNYLHWESDPQWLQRVTTAQKDALCDVFRRSRAWFCPTLSVMFSFQADPRTSQDPRLKYVPASQKQTWVALDNQKTPDGKGQGRQRLQDALGLIGAMHRGGVNFLAGTDSLPFSEYGGVPVLPGFGLHDELADLVLGGVSPMDALRSATFKPAEFIGLLDLQGTVEVGKLAEIVLLDANPLADIANTQKVDAVITGGRLYRRGALDAILHAVEARVAAADAARASRAPAPR
jgi:imidazolonepropionase-like amidohydrolase